MQTPGHVSNCKCIQCKPEGNAPKPGPYGFAKNFRDMVDRFGDMFRPYKMDIYPGFCVYDFTMESEVEDYLDDRSAKLYTGIHYDRNNYLIVVIDVEELDKVMG